MTSLLSRAGLSVLALALVFGVSTLHAQRTGADTLADTSTYRLPAVTVLAHGRASARENRMLERELIGYNRRIAALEARLHHLRTVVTDSLETEIQALSSAALATRARRMKLEERMRALQSRDPSPADSAPVPPVRTSSPL